MIGVIIEAKRSQKIGRDRGWQSKERVISLASPHYYIHALLFYHRETEHVRIFCELQVLIFILILEHGYRLFVFGEPFRIYRRYLSMPTPII